MNILNVRRVSLVRSQESAAGATGSRARGIPLPVGLAGGLLLALFVIPLIALVVRTVGGLPGHPLAMFDAAVRSAVRLSLATTAVSMVVIAALGGPLAYLFARYQFRFKGLLNVLIELPIVLPPVVAGLALLMAFGRRGLVGSWLAEAGIMLPFTPAAIVMVQVFVSAPFFIRAAQVRFAAIPRELEEAADIDGAGRWRVFTLVTLPLSWGALLTGLLLAWARALGEFGATILFAGNLQGRTQTMPLLVYSALERDLDTALWTGLILVGVAVAVLAAVQLLNRLFAGEDGEDPLAGRF